MPLTVKKLTRLIDASIIKDNCSEVGVNVFISYAHNNIPWLLGWKNAGHTVTNSRCLLEQWYRTLRKKNVEFWFDREKQNGLHGGEEWRSRIFHEVDRADIAILLVTQDFLTSPFIIDEELPYILKRCRKGGLLLLPVLVQPVRSSDLTSNGLEEWQWTPDGAMALSEYYDRSMSEFEKAKIKVLDSLESLVDKVIRNRTGARQSTLPPSSPKQQTKVEMPFPPGKSTLLPFLFKAPKRFFVVAGVTTIFIMLMSMAIIMLLRNDGAENTRRHAASDINKKDSAAVQAPQKDLSDSKPSLPAASSVQNVPETEMNDFVLSPLPVSSEEDDAQEKSVEKSAAVDTASSVSTTSVPKEKMLAPDMVRVKGGTYMMGSEDGEDDEKPVHQVTVSGFHMDKTEVTNEQYNACVSAGKCSPAHYNDGTALVWKGRWRKGKVENGFRNPNHPVVAVTWKQAKTYCEWRNSRLPTEAEWEFAARAGTATRYFWGENKDDACRHGNVADEMATRNFAEIPSIGCEDGYALTSPVGKYLKNRNGLSDMTGNVWEWCGDWYGPYTEAAAVNPHGNSAGRYRVIRGGSLYDNEKTFRTANRRWMDPDTRTSNVGFRCVRTP
jgi:formylglycine-generating enzyme required for sulfatase activity